MRLGLRCLKAMVRSERRRAKSRRGFSGLLTSNIVKAFTKISGSGSVKLLEGYVLGAAQGGQDFTALGRYMVASLIG